MGLPSAFGRDLRDWVFASLLFLSFPSSQVFLSSSYCFFTDVEISLSHFLSSSVSLYHSHALFCSSLLSHFSKCTPAKRDWSSVLFLSFSSVHEPFCSTVSKLFTTSSRCTQRKIFSLKRLFIHCVLQLSGTFLFKIYVLVQWVLEQKLEFIKPSVLWK